MIKDPIITAKIRYFREILKEFAVSERHNKNVFKHNMRLYTQHRDLGRWFGDTATWPKEEQAKLKTYVDSYLSTDSITALHVYYLKIKGVNKQHTKDDKAYESLSHYKASIQEFEEGFVVSQNAGKEGHHVA